MKTIFISHSGPDSEIAKSLADALKLSGHDVIIDIFDLKPGEDVIDFMNDAIDRAQFIVILFSKSTADAKWQQKESTAALWQEVQKENKTIIIVRLDDEPLPPLLATKRYLNLPNDTKQEIMAVINQLSSLIHTPDHPSPSEVVTEAFNVQARNPFRRVRAEYFGDSLDLIKTFAPPDPLRMQILEDPDRPCFLEGPRGTGKSMLLLAMRGRNFILRNQDNQNAYELFGFYLKLTPPILCNPGFPPNLDEDERKEATDHKAPLMDIASQEIILSLLESLIGEIRYCKTESLLTFDAITESSLADKLNTAIFATTESISPTTLSELQDILANLHTRIAEFIRRRFTYNEKADVPVATLDLGTIRRVIAKIKEHIENLDRSSFIVLLDEYENLRPEHQSIVNTIVKLAAPDFTVKIGKKIGIVDTASTTIGQELQENHDYKRITLVYDVQNHEQFRAYCKLLSKIVSNIMTNENLPYSGIDKFLPKASEPPVTDKEMLPFLEDLSSAKSTRGGPYPERKASPGVAYYRVAAQYRALHKYRRKQHFSGVRTLAFLSSGVVRYFQEIVGVAFHLANSPHGGNDGSGGSLPPEHQSRSVHLISEHTLTALSKNVEKHGESLKHLLLDLGSLLRHKLLTHSSEPEAGRLTIENPEVLTGDSFLLLRSILDLGVREGVFQTREGRPAFRPKHRSDPHPAEFNISRILAPVLELSPRLRWRTTVSAEALRDLVVPEQRPSAMKQLFRAVGNTPSPSDSPQRPLF